MRGLSGKVAIVTGGAGGIGSTTAERLIAEGATVVIADLYEESAQAVADALGDKAVAMHFDAGDEHSVKTAIDATYERFGRVDILHNNAVLNDPVALEKDTVSPDIPLEVWDKTMTINVRGYLLGCKFAIPYMVKNGGGAIVNMASDSGLSGDVVRIGYGTSKGAVIAMTKYIATQHGRQGIRCNAIAPGYIHTRTNEKVAPELLDILSRHVLTTRLGHTDDIASLVAFLASDESGYITGQTIPCDGGLLAHLPQFAEMQNQMG